MAKTKVTKKTEVEESAVATAEEGEEDDEVVEAESKTVITGGQSLEIFSDDVEGVFVALRKDMSPEERREAVREVMHKATEVDDKLQLVKGEMLHEVSSNGYWKEWTFTDAEGEERAYASFEEYAEEECGVKRRTAFYMIKVYRTYVEELDLPVETLKKLEWSKAKELVGVIDPENAEELLDKVSEMPVSQVKKMVKDMKKPAAPGGTAEGTSEKTSTKSFKLTEEQAENLDQALEIAGSLCGSDKPSAQLDFICSDFLSSAASSGTADDQLAALDTMVSNIERAFGVKLEVTDLDESRLVGEGDDEEEETDDE